MTPLTLQSRLRSHGLTARGYAVLQEIELSPETMSHISKVVKSSLQNLSAIADTLESYGLAGRAKEGRSTMLRITEKGLKAMAEIEREDGV